MYKLDPADPTTPPESMIFRNIFVPAILSEMKTMNKYDLPHTNRVAQYPIQPLQIISYEINIVCSDTPAEIPSCSRLQMYVFAPFYRSVTLLMPTLSF